MTVSLTYRALTNQGALLPRLLAAEPHLDDELREIVARGVGFPIG